jgi:N-acetylneuraminic acid mutarotase
MKKILLAVFALFSTTLFAQTWERMVDAPIGRHHPISFSLDGKGYAVTGSLSNGQPTDDVYEYNPQSNLWLTKADFPGTARSFGIGTVANGKAYIGFGASTTQYLNDLWSYDPTNSTWTRLADCICTGRRHPAMMSVGNRIYVGLGDNNINGNLRDWYMYDISTDSWTQIANLPGPARHHPFMFNAGGEVFAGLGHGGSSIYNDWYKLDTATNTWSAMNNFPDEGRVAGTQFGTNGYGYLLSGDGDNHSYMDEGEMWRYDPNNDSWSQLTSHPGKSRWAPGSFVIDSNVYFFGGLNRFTGILPNDLWKFDLTDTTTGINEKQLALTNTYVYPNPADDIVSWKNDPIITDVKVYNSLGQVLLTSAAEAKEVDVHELSNGLYFVQFYAKNELLKTSKVLINN